MRPNQHAHKKRILLDNAQHTIYSDEPWYLIVDDASGNVHLEARFQSDAPDRTVFPDWAATDYCVSKSTAEAVCRVSFPSAVDFLAKERPSVVPETIWDKAIRQCRKTDEK